MSVSAPPPLLGSPLGYIAFQGDGWGQTPGKPGPSHPIVVLCGDSQPVITDGTAIWGNIPRPLLRGLSIFQGYNPTVMTIDLRFGQFTSGWDISPAAGTQTEDYDIHWMRWMAGEGFAVGPSPIVYVSSYGVYPSQPNHLIPAEWQGPTVPWVISGLTWGTAYRNKGGDRVWQEATVTLMQYLSVQNKPPPQTSAQAGYYFLATPARNTALKIANATSSHATLSQNEAFAGLIISASQNASLSLRSIRQKLKVGAKVYIPPRSTGFGSGPQVGP